MPLAPRPRAVNPRLGAYFGVFTGAVISAFVLLLIFEQLGVSATVVRWAMLLVPFVAYIGIGGLAYASEPADFFAAGRRVPAVFVGIGLATSAFGGIGLIALPGVFYAIGFDAICLITGGIAGFVVMAVLLAPFLRKHGAYTIPGFLGNRMHSRSVRIVAAALMSVPILLVIAAEIRLGATALAILTGYSLPALSILLALIIIATIAPGGMRSLSWSNVAQAIVVLLAVLVPAAIVGVIETNLPIPQLSHGPVLRGLGRNEVMQGVPVVVTAPLSMNFPGQELVTAISRYATPFSGVGPLGFVLMSLIVMSGVAAAPWLLPRITTVPSVYEARKSLGWATFLFGLTMLTIATLAMFVREAVMEIVVAGRPMQLPQWLAQLADMGLARVPGTDERLAVSAFAIHRDTVLLALPLTENMPGMFAYLVIAGAVGASLLAASTAAMALAAIIGEDVLAGLSWEPLSSSIRIMAGRVAIAFAVVLATAISLIAATDPLRMFLWALTISAGASFPVLVLSVWWKRLSLWGTIAGLSVGFAVTLIGIFMCEARILPFESALSAAAGLPLAAAAAIAVSILLPAADRKAVEITRDIRIPGGETLYDKEIRLLRLKQRQRS